MEELALAMSALSLAVAIVGTVLSNRRAAEAIAESRKASAAALWSDAQEAVQRLIGLDPTAEPVGERIASLRITMIALIDGLDGWDGLDQWLEAERALGATLGRQILERSQRGDTVEERLSILDPYQQWAQVLGMNLRQFRNVGYDAAAVASLCDHARRELKRVCTENGWPLPPTTIPGLREIPE